eukprot:13772620-Alexandrium_andersonii.AAC.1
MRPDSHLDQTEEHDIRLMGNNERWQLAMRMMQRVTRKQEWARLNVRGTHWVLSGIEMPQQFYNDMAAFT